MPKKRIRIDLEDNDGAKYNFNLEGNVTREKILKIFELMDLMNVEEEQDTQILDTIGAKIWHVVDKFFPVGKFTSSELREKYEDEYSEPIKLATISTYLSRFNTKGRIERARTGREWVYQTIKITQKNPGKGGY